ncbi:murein transglycosylase A [Hasllibacter halocynthiae]|nr:MltA domain-containing protein [Hasllibacter halocynthiae]
MAEIETAPRHEMLRFDELDGWAGDDHAAALAVFQTSCHRPPGPDWDGVCAVARRTEPAQARAFFEAFFRPVLTTAGPGGGTVFTAYYEPELAGSPRRTARFDVPLYAVPPELPEGGAWLTRAEIEAGALAGRNLEIAWVEDPVDLFFLQVQGSGRVRFPGGGGVRVGYGGKNGHEYRSVGLEMIRRGLVEEHRASAEVIRAFVRTNPDEGRALLRHNASYVFFREVEVDPALGPLGALNLSLVPHRSIAVDPGYHPLGAPVWIEKDGAAPIRRLAVAQDTGSAIRGAQRADIFWGTGAEAGLAAGRVRDGGRMVTLLPVRAAYALAPDTGL